MTKKRTSFRVPPTARQRALRVAEVNGQLPDLQQRRHEARMHQREAQQGLGKPIVSTEFGGRRFVAVGNSVRSSPRWKTFHDFLMDYARDVFGRDWWRAEQAQPREQRHPVVTWFELAHTPQGGGVAVDQVVSRPMTGAAAAYLHLAYDLYGLENNAELRERLVQRLKNKGNFHGAHYEVHVAAVFVRAGFTLTFENEDDPTTSHCEFTACNQRTGRFFSVEAKRREWVTGKNPANGRQRIGKKLSEALRKQANHPRVVFIDVNAPDAAASSNEMPNFMRRALEDARRFELGPGRGLPRAYLFITNHPFQHDLGGTSFRSVFIGEGFHIAEFKGDARFGSVREMVDARDAHVEMHQLARSMAEHAVVPATFDGEVPELAFGEHPPRMRIGDRYLVPDGSGLMVPGTLESAAVVESERVAYGAYALADGRRIIVTTPLTDAELAANRSHPKTFFGVVDGPEKVSDPVDMYDFFMLSYAQTPRERLLEFLASAPDFEQLTKLEQPELARIYCERCVEWSYRPRDGKRAPTTG